MNIHPFTNRGHRVSQTNCSSRVATAKGQNTATCSTRRWQPRRKKAISAPSCAQWFDSTLSEAEQITLLRQQALTAAQQGDYKESIALFNCLIDRKPNSANDYSNRGLVYFQSGQSNPALEDYNRAIALNPRLDSAYNNRANYYAAQGQFLEAILDYDIALDLNPTNVRAWINQGITFRELEMYDRAIESFDLALCLGRLDGHIYAERGRAYHLRGDWNCAFADYQRALEKLPVKSSFPHDPSVRLRLQVESWLDELMSPLKA